MSLLDSKSEIIRCSWGATPSPGIEFKHLLILEISKYFFGGLDRRFYMDYRHW